VDERVGLVTVVESDGVARSLNDRLVWVHRDDRPRLAAAVADLLAQPFGEAAVGARVQHADGVYRRVSFRAVNLLPDPDVRAVEVTVTPVRVV
jgi:hypothetical protein